MGVDMRMNRGNSAALVCLALLLLPLGAVLGYFLGRSGLSRQFQLSPYPAGCPRTGSYSMRLGRGRNSAEIQFTVDRRTGVPNELDLFQGLGRKHTFSLFYKRRGQYGVPEVTLFTGSLAVAHGWTDVGLRGRFLIQGNSPVETLLDGKWVSGYAVHGGTITYKGTVYRYGKRRGGWVPVPPRRAPAASDAARVGTP